MEMLKVIALLCQVHSFGNPVDVLTIQQKCQRDLMECITSYNDRYNSNEWKLSQCVREPSKRVR